MYKNSKRVGSGALRSTALSSSLERSLTTTTKKKELILNKMKNRQMNKKINLQKPHPKAINDIAANYTNNKEKETTAKVALFRVIFLLIVKT